MCFDRLHILPLLKQYYRSVSHTSYFRITYELLGVCLPPKLHTINLSKLQSDKLTF